MRALREWGGSSAGHKSPCCQSDRALQYQTNTIPRDDVMQHLCNTRTIMNYKNTVSTSMSTTMSNSMSATFFFFFSFFCRPPFGHHVGHRNVSSALCEVSETLTEWKSESISYLRTEGLARVGARDTCLELLSFLWSKRGLKWPQNQIEFPRSSSKLLLKRGHFFNTSITMLQCTVNVLQYESSVVKTGW